MYMKLEVIEVTSDVLMFSMMFSVFLFYRVRVQNQPETFQSYYCGAWSKQPPSQT